MQINTRRIEYRWGETWTLKPLFDVHVGNKACDERAFRSYLEDSDERTLFLGGGDLMDAVIVSDAKRYRKGIDASDGEDIVDYQVERTASFLRPYRERILGLGSGNHEDAIVTHCSTDMTRRLCRLIDVPYLGYSGLYKLAFTDNNQRGRSVIIRYHHGWAGGRTPGGQLTSNTKDLVNWDADIFLYGHGHKLLTDSVTRLGFCGDKLVSRDLLVCLCGSFLKTYLLDETTYSEKKGYSPQKIGSPSITMRPTRTGIELKAHTN